MNVTLSIDDDIIKEARKIAKRMGKSLDQLIRDDLERLTRKHHLHAALEELRTLDGKGNSEGWKFDRDALHERG